MILNRRKLFIGLGATLITAPAIVRAVSLMQVKSYPAISMRMISEYIPSDDVAIIDVLYGTLYIAAGRIIKVKGIDVNEIG